jgi:ribosomal protein L1
LGEELKRPFDYICSVIDNEGIKLKQEGYNHQLKHLIEKDIAQFSEKLKNAMEHQQIDPKNLDQHLSEEFNEFLPQEKINKFKFSTYQDKNEMANAKLLKFITRNQNIQDKKNDAFKHGVIAGEELL